MATFRIDDVNPNTNFSDLHLQLVDLRERGHSVILGINLFAMLNNDGSVYPNPPFKDKDASYFYGVDRMLDRYDIVKIGARDYELASHGLIHTDHSKLSRDAQEMSIATSCNYLSANKFIPPFNFYNEDTVRICEEYDVELVRNTEEITWNSLETQDFDPNKSHWYYHPWRLNYHQFMDKFNASTNYNQLP